jgi:hypothetical protein
MLGLLLTCCANIEFFKAFLVEDWALALVLADIILDDWSVFLSYS